jgi:hypothetical protein
MNRALSFVRLDFLTVKPYLTLKNMLIFVGVALIVIVGNNSVGGAIGILMALASLYASYPFAVGEKSGMDVLYATLSIPRKTVVLGRYLFALTLDVSVGLLAFGFSVIARVAVRKDFDMIRELLTVIILFLFFSIVQAIQLPIYFKLGYTKAKLLAYLPFVALPLAVLAASSLLRDVFSIEAAAGLIEWFTANLPATALLGGAVWLGMMAVSCKTSLSLYGKRDF